jgi:integrase
MQRHIVTALKTWPRLVKVGGTVVKVYRYARPDGSFSYQVADYSTGARKLRSFPTGEAALAEAERLARLLASGEAHAARVGGRELAGYGRAVELLRPTGIALEVAAAHYAEAVKVLGGDRVLEAARFFASRDPSRLPVKTVAEAVEELLTVKEARGASRRYLGDLRSRLARFADAFHCPLASVTTGDVQRWLDGLKAAPQTVRNFRTVAGTLFSFAEARGYLPKGGNPVEATEPVKTRNGDAVEVFTPGELAALLAAAPADFRPLVALGAFTGIRAAEALRLDWSDVDLAGAFVTVGAAKAKTRARRLVPICPALAAWLAPYAGRTGRVWHLGPDAFNKRAAATAKAAGVPWKANGLRHSFASYRLAQTQDAAKVALEMGNSPAVIFAHYRELVRPDAAAAWFSVRPEAPANVLPLAANA